MAIRVLIYTAAEKGDAAGVQGVVLGLADHLRGKGHDVITAWPDGDATPRDWRLRLETGVGPAGRPTPGGLSRAAVDGAWLAARLARFRPDVVNLHYPRGQTLYFEALRRFLRYRLVLSYHGSDYHEASDALRARLPGWLAGADAVTAVSEDLGARLSTLAGRLCPTVIANGIDTRFWSPGTGVRHPWLVVAAGRLIPLKRFDLLLSAFAEGGPARGRLLIAGDGPERSALDERIRVLGLRDRVTLSGRLDRSEMRDLFRRAGLFVLPSEREGMPLVLLEAMATGLPAVATAVGGVPSIMTPGTGDLVAPEDRRALAEAISLRLGHGEALSRQGAAARARVVADFDAAASFGAYEAVMRGRGSQRGT